MSRLKRVLFWQITLLPTYFVAFLALLVATALEAAAHGPYTSWVNHRLAAKAEQARLVGRSVAEIPMVLGPPDNVRSSWEVIGPAGTESDARRVVSYEYYPYPWVPFSKFQVHTTDGRVRSVELFDD